MRVRVYRDPAFASHQPGPHHPESPDRYRAILSILQDRPDAPWTFATPTEASQDMVALAHDAEFVEALLAAVPREGFAAVDSDTVMSPDSGRAALLGAGAAVAAVDDVIAGTADRVFCAVRPPGHHAEHNRAMGFCLFNNLAVAARHALTVDGIERVSIVDFDVHHGNGTQDIFWSDPRVQYLSSHQMPLYPGTGASDETGVGNIVNVPLLAGCDSESFRQAYNQRLLPALREFDPDLLLVSAGFDAHRLDPLASLNLETGDFAWVTRELVAVAADLCQGRLVSALEGGYHLQALADSVLAHVEVLASS
ncbi:MAG: histone deacetylase family protein [Xanthomonadales bacterium]|nr:histone deacetylase family protein [Xanthomonadales bacterium]